ncbi:MAG: hypothetical protein JW709_01000, partial [Sedimentisphaerales bacterium]|nr:hypothetical protein [Sedimentisphaerales bacterium]
GSLILGRHYPQQPSSAVYELTDQSVNLDELIRQVAGHIAEKFNMTLQQTGLNGTETAALPAAREQFASDSWNCQR